jgi:hypothetical protein
MNNKQRVLLYAVLGLLAYAITLLPHILDDSALGSEARVDFGKAAGKIGLAYGANEDNWFEFSRNQELRKFHEDVGSQYIRVWLSAQPYKPSSFPLQPDGSYDFGGVDAYISSVLDSGAIPFVVFAHYNVCGLNDKHYPAPFDFSWCEGNGVPPAHDDIEFAAYIAEVVEHFAEKCLLSKYSKSCDVNEWYFEIWNEPYGAEWWTAKPPRYSLMFNVVREKIKDIVPGAKVGGPGGVFVTGFPSSKIPLFLESSNPDFVSIHHYGNILALMKYTDSNRIRDVEKILYDSPRALRELTLKGNSPNIEIVNSEYSSDNSGEYAQRLDEDFTAAWYASALISQIKSQAVDIELFYGGSSRLSSGGFGMWNVDGRRYPTYFMKKSFVHYNLEGSIIFESKSSEKFEILAVQNGRGKFITAVNKGDRHGLMDLRLSGGEFEGIVDLQSGQRLRAKKQSVQVEFGPYEVRFFEVI